MQVVCDKYFFKQSLLKVENVTKSKHDEATEQNKNLFCKFCKSSITDLDAVIFVNGAQSHTFSNPAGYIYTIQCFNTAPGCDIVGVSSDEHTWFNGYVWQIAVCNSCREQLGWLFSEHDQFYGLISDRLVTSS